eukprot:CAMPEP_0119482828 /NCGR_PEP_ID=MMETSP1344-20130328/10518_1 /TAXON_ID=236787 /ORGANISM="Florenciella parvula, Strain CCMP2471" /LENGTH=1126 /DNA_ID=CAMNT_0007517281 /DNA_START=194 /DNA_END=3571 /DNA_ORIENTATION=+
MADSWEEKFMRLQEDNLALKKKFNDKKEEVKQTNVQLTKIENLLKLKDKLDAQNDGTGYMSSLMRAENEKLIKKLYTEKAEAEGNAKKLEAQNKKLRETLKQRKARITVLEGQVKRNGGRPASASKGVVSSPTRAAASGGGADGEEEAVARAASNAKLGDLVTRLGSRLENAEQTLTRVREENRKLRAERDEMRGTGADADDMAAAGARNAISIEPRSGEKASLQLQRELQDTKAQLHLLQTRYDHLEAKARAQTELQQGSFDQLEDYNKQIRRLRGVLQDLQSDKIAAEARAANLDEKESELRELREQNANYEQKIKTLCESPFISDAYKKQDSAQRLAEYERNERTTRLKLEHLQETAQNHHAALVAMKDQCQELKIAKESAEAERDEYKSQLSTSEAGNNVLKDKMTLYAGDDGVDVHELEKALTIVKRRDDPTPDMSHLGLEAVEGDVSQLANGPDAVPALKRKVKELYDLNQQMRYELDRTEDMRKAQVAINKELHIELTSLQQLKDTEAKDLVLKVKDLEGLAARRLARVGTLEAQVKQQLYSVKMGHKGKALLPGLAEGDEDDATAGGDTLLEELGGADNLGADENIVEVWVKEAALDENGEFGNPGAPTFVIIDFFNFESEATPVLEGRKPQYDFASTYRINMDDFFLKFLATQTLVIELSQVQGADFELIGRAAIPLFSLLQTRPKIALEHEPLLSPRNGLSIGSVHVEVRLAVPVDQLYQLFLDQHPEERAHIDRVLTDRYGPDAQLAAANPAALSAEVMHASEDPVQRLHNEIEVLVYNAQGLPPRDRTDGQAPSTYVHYQLLNFQDTFTPAISDTFDPVYEHKERFPFPTNPAMLGLLTEGMRDGGDGPCLELTVLDDIEDEDGDPHIGTARVPLAPLCEGDEIHARLSLISSSDAMVGTLRVVVRWRHPFATEADSGPDALSARDVSTLLNRFSPVQDGQVHWKAFLGWVQPTLMVKTALERIRQFVERSRITKGLNADEIFSGINDHFTAQDLVSTSAQWQLGVTADEWTAVFNHLDVDGFGSVARSELIKYVGSKRFYEAQLEAKVVAHVQGLRPGTVQALFEAEDTQGSRRVTREQFKLVLKQIGFKLFEEPDRPALLQVPDRRYDGAPA